MTLSRTPAFAATDPPPVPEAKRWVAGRTFPTERPLIDVSQAAPVDPPPEALRKVLAEAMLAGTDAHLYGPVLGNPELRAELARHTAQQYRGSVGTEQVAITQGCNQAFCATMATLAGPGDEVLIPTPWYFNHKMWLDMTSVRAVPLPAGPGLIPRPEDATARITNQTRAIALTTPNNPAGVEYPAATLKAFYDLCRDRGLTLIVDETYRDFLSHDDPPHALFQEPDWDTTLVGLYSFSKAYRLTGHRAGAIFASPDRLAEVEKFQDTVAICPSQTGQIGALYGLQHLGDWRAGERAEVLDRRAAITEHLPRDKGWQLLGLGAYFAYVAHPFDAPSDVVAKHMVDTASILCLPATMFTPKGDAEGAKALRIAFANIDRSGIETLCARLAQVTEP